MPKRTIEEINERREKVYFLLLEGQNPQQIKRTLNLTQATVYRDVQALAKRSKSWMYDMAKNLHVLAYQKSIEGIGLTLSESWKKFRDPNVPEKQKASYLRLTKECNERIFELIASGPVEAQILSITERASKLGIDSNDIKPKLTAEEQIQNYINSVNAYPNDADFDTGNKRNTDAGDFELTK